MYFVAHELVFEASNNTECASVLFKFKAPSRVETLVEFAVSLKGKFYSNKSLPEPHKVEKKPAAPPPENQPKKPIVNLLSDSISFFTSRFKSPAEESKGTKFVLEEEESTTPLDKIETSIDILKKENLTKKSESITKVIRLLQEALGELK